MHEFSIQKVVFGDMESSINLERNPLSVFVTTASNETAIMDTLSDTDWNRPMNRLYRTMFLLNLMLFKKKKY